MYRGNAQVMQNLINLHHEFKFMHLKLYDFKLGFLPTVASDQHQQNQDQYNESKVVLKQEHSNHFCSNKNRIRVLQAQRKELKFRVKTETENSLSTRNKVIELSIN